MALDFAKNEWLHKFKLLDSTNNYAMKLIDDGLASNGVVVWALAQSQGKGRRGKQWLSNEGENLMMSLIVQPTKDLQKQPFLLNVLVALVLCDYVAHLVPDASVCIKWPNDIYINDKKTAGILIENTFRGMNWTSAVIGIGLNVHQTEFPPQLINATSLKLFTNNDFELLELLADLRAGILNKISNINSQNEMAILNSYNERLYRKGQLQLFMDIQTNENFEGKILSVSENGDLQVKVQDEERSYSFGSISWQLGSSK